MSASRRFPPPWSISRSIAKHSPPMLLAHFIGDCADPVIFSL
jgi:hypothetical protein